MAIDEEDGSLSLREDADDGVERELHRAIAKVGDDIDRMSFNTAIAAMIEFVNVATGTGVTADQLDRFNRILAPFAPHIAEEIHELLGHPGGADYVTRAAWPSYDSSMLEDDAIEVPVQVLGKVRSRITVPSGSDDETLEAAALQDPRIIEVVGDRKVRKVIVVPGKLVNLVVG